MHNHCNWQCSKLRRNPTKCQTGTFAKETGRALEDGEGRLSVYTTRPARWRELDDASKRCLSMQAIDVCLLACIFLGIPGI